MGNGANVSPLSFQILDLLAHGCTTEQIKSQLPGVTIVELSRAAQEALQAIHRLSNFDSIRIQEIRLRHPRAFTTWTAQEDAFLKQFVAGHHSIETIASRLQRQPSAIRSRLAKLNFKSNSPW